MEASEARRARQEAAERYRPELVDLLIVAEAPPSALDRYFYFENVQEQDSALLRWLNAGRGGVIRPRRYQITRASSANASARRKAGGTSDPRS